MNGTAVKKGRRSTKLINSERALEASKVPSPTLGPPVIELRNRSHHGLLLRAGPPQAVSPFPQHHTRWGGLALGPWLVTFDSLPVWVFPAMKQGETAPLPLSSGCEDTEQAAVGAPSSVKGFATLLGRQEILMCGLL